uniref:Uncharacterized protein n=1 Tax=viral metagenome TaxID=1070528 RepID=A0A6M3JLI5_9ZZZZ
METIFREKKDKYWQVERDGESAQVTSALREGRNAVARFFKEYPDHPPFRIIIEPLDKIDP